MAVARDVANDRRLARPPLDAHALEHVGNSELQERSTARDEARPGVANNEIPSALLQALFAAIDRRGELEPVADADGVLGVQRGFESAAKGWRHHVATLEIVYDRTAFKSRTMEVMRQTCLCFLTALMCTIHQRLLTVIVVAATSPTTSI